MDDSFFCATLVDEFDEADSEYGIDCSKEEVDFAEQLMKVDDSDVDDSDEDGDINLSVREIHEAEDLKLDNFMNKTGNCHFGSNGKACSSLFTRSEISSSRINCKEMSKSELDLVILASLEANRRCDNNQEGTRSHINYWFHGHKVCKATYLFLHAVGAKHYKNLIVHFCQNGLTSRAHGNTKRLPYNTLPFSQTEDVVQFIKTFANLHALPLPGRIPGQYTYEKALLLPSDMTKRFVYWQYCSACAGTYYKQTSLSKEI